MKLTNLTVFVCIAALTSFAVSAKAPSEAQVSAVQKAVAGVPVPELAATAAQIVAQSKEAEQAQVALATVRVIVSKRAASAPAVVGAIAKVAPQTSADVAAEAAKLAPNQAAEIAKAAAAAAPAHAEKIAEAVVKTTPRAALQITRAVVNVVPLASLKVVESVIAAVPQTQAQIQNDPVITRITRNTAAHHGGVHGVPSSGGGTIVGDERPVAPVAVTTVTPGSDPNRYASPTP